MVQVHLGPLASVSAAARTTLAGPEGIAVKKKLLLLLAAVGGLVAFKKRSAAKTDADLWQEATRPSPDLR